MTARSAADKKRSRLPLVLMALAGVLIGQLSAGVMRADAAWPSGGVRTMSGKGCGRHSDNLRVVCPYEADTVFPTADNTWIYVDYHTTGPATQTYAMACYGHYYGFTLYSCGSPGITSATGSVDLGIEGFSHLYTGVFDASLWDYFHVLLYMDGTGGGHIDAVYGVSFSG